MINANKTRRILALTLIPLAAVTLAGCQSAGSTDPVIAWGDVDLSDIDWDVTCIGWPVTGVLARRVGDSDPDTGPSVLIKADKDGTIEGVSIHGEDPEVSLLYVAGSEQGEDPEAGGSFKHRGQQVVAEGKAYSRIAGTTDRELVDFEVRLTCPDAN